MNESAYYPAGAYSDPNAPYNETVVPEREFDVTVTVTLTKSETITTVDYSPEFDEETGGTYANTQDTDWQHEYEENCYTIPNLLNELKNYITADLEKYKGSPRTERRLNKMLAACDGWSVEETDITEE